MDMMERRIREIFATVLSRGAKALERTASELERASSQMRADRRRTDEAERVWSEESPARERDTMIRSAPLRAVPDTPTDEPAGDPPDLAPAEGVRDAEGTAAGWTTPVDSAPRPDAERPAGAEAAATSSTVAGASADGGGGDAGADRLAELSAGTVTQIRPQLGELSPDELRRLRDIEVAGRNRSTLIAAIDRTLADLP